MRLEINGRIVEVDDSFADLTPDEQNSTVEEIAASIGMEQPAQQPVTGGDVPSMPTQEEIDRSLYDPSSGVGGAQAALIGLGKGFSDVARGVGLMDNADETVKAGYSQLENKHPIAAGGGEIVGQALPFVPLALGAAAAAPAAGTSMGLGASGTQALNIAGQGLVGALEGGTIAKGQDKSVLAGAGIGGLVSAGVEAVSPVVGRAVTSVFRKLTGKAPVGKLITPDGKASKELADALQSHGLSVDDLAEETKRLIDPNAANADEVARKAFLESQGLTPTRAQVTRGAADFQSQQEAAKTSSRVRDALEKQEAVLTSRFNNAVIDTGGQASSPTSSVIDSVVGKASKLDNEVSRLYKMAKESAPTDKKILFRGTKDKLDSLLQADAATGGAVSAIKGDLINRGILRTGPEISGYPSTVAHRKVDVQTAEEARKFINGLYDPANPFRNSVLREIKDSIDDDVFRHAGKDVFKEARQSKAGFEKELARAKISKFDDRKANIVRDVLENKINPDKFVDDVVYSKKWRADDLDQLKNYITDHPEGKAAFNDLRAETLHSIKTKAFIGPEDAMGNKALSRDALEKELKAIGKPKLQVLFDEKEQKFLGDMLRVAKLREPVRGTQQGRGPSAQAIAKLEQRLKELPVMGSIVNFINLDAQGRIALKAAPARMARQALPYEKELGAITGTVSVPLITQEQ